MDLVLHYGGKTTEKTVDLRFKKKEFNYLLGGGISLGVLIVIGLIIWIVFKFRKLKKSGKGKKGK